MRIVFLGLTLSSSWGNGHATTYRALIRGLSELGHDVAFLERDVEWYAENRDLASPDFCDLVCYGKLDRLRDHRPLLAAADAVIVGSYVPDGVAVIDYVLGLRDHGIAFYDIDTPVTLARLRRGEEQYLARRQIPRFDCYLSFAGGPSLERLETDFGARRAEALYCSVDERAYRHTGEPIRWDLGYLGTYSPDRQPGLERLLIEPARRLPEGRFVVAGPQYPLGIEWPPNVERIDHLPPAAHASFYSRQRFTLNLTRTDMAAVGWSPSVRLFEAAASAVPIITDRWAGLDDILPTGSVIVADNSSDVVEVLTRLPEAERQRIAGRAHDRVIDRHTGRARATELIELLDFAGPVLCRPTIDETARGIPI